MPRYGVTTEQHAQLEKELAALHTLFDAAKKCVQGKLIELFPNLMDLVDAVHRVQEVCEW